MKMRAFCLISLAFATISGFAASRAFFDDFESYAVGSNLHGQGGWTGWANNPNAGALVSSNFAFSPTRSVNIAGASDLVHTFSGATNGPWVFSVMQYIPSTSTGTTAVILMNKYRPPYGTNDLNWSVQIQNNMDTGQIISDFGGGATLPMVKDQWVEERCEINLASNSVSEFYNGQLLSTHAWQGGLGGPGLNEIQALDLFANNAGPVYYDNVSLDLFQSYTIPINAGLNLIANQLDHGSNTANEVFANIPNGCVLSKYNNGSGTWSNAYFSAGSWMPGTLTLSPGEGAYLQSPTNFTLTVTGTPHVPVLPVSISPGHLYLLSCQTNDTGTWNNIVGTDPQDGTLAYTYNGGFTAYQYSSDDGAWLPSAPSVPVGSALWIRTPGGGGNLYPPPVITEQPMSVAPGQGQTTTFLVAAVGTPPLSYQWRFNLTNILSGATNATYTVVNAQAYDAGAYDVVVSNPGGSVTSQVATLQLWQSYTINLPGDGQGIYLIANQLDHGSNTLDEVLPNMPDGTTLEKWDCSLQDFDSISVFSAASGHWDPNETLVPGEGAFFIPAGHLSSITFTGTPHVPVLPAALPCGYGVPTTLSRQTNDVGTFENIIGLQPTEGSQVALWNPPTADWAIYTFSGCTWTPNVPSVGIGQAALITVAPPSTAPPTILSDVSDQTACAGNSVSFSVTACGTPPLSYQWQKNGANLSDSSHFTGTHTSTLTVSNASTSDLGAYDVVITNAFGTNVSSTANLFVNPCPPVITQQPMSVSATQGQTTTFTVAAVGTPPLNYQWSFNITNILSGATNTSYTVSSAQQTNAGLYSVVVANAFGSVTSAPALLRIINVTEGRLQCQDGSPLANCTVTVDFWANGSRVVSVTATTDNTGYFSCYVDCSPYSGLQTDRKFVISSSCCPNQTWTLPSQCCCGNIGTLVCTNCGLGPTTMANKDFQNNTGQAVDDIEWLLQGTYSSVISHYDGPYPGQLNTTFSSFTIVPSGANTLLRWSGGASIPSGGFAHVGFTVPGSSVTTLGASWTIGGVYAGCVHQVSVWQGFSHTSGQVIFLNTATNCESQILYVGNIRLEWFSTNVPLAELNAVGVRSPLRADDLSSPPVPLSPGGSAPVAIPLPPAGALFAMIRYTVSSSPTLAGPGNTIDYQEVPLSLSPVITQQPQNQTNVFGSNVTFSVTASGVPPLSYQWIAFQGSFTNILSGATNSTYTVFNAQFIDPTNYYVVVSNPGGSVASLPATLTLRAAIHTYVHLICTDGSPLAGCSVTLTYYDSGPATGTDTATTDGNGRIDFIGNFGQCEDDNNYGNGHFVVTASCCPNQSWTINTPCCCGDLGTLTCNNCSGSATCDPGKVFWVDPNGLAIYSSDLNGQNPNLVHTFPSYGAGWDVAVDPVTGNIYYGDNHYSPGKVIKADNTGAFLGEVATTPVGNGGGTVWDIAVAGNNVFWLDLLDGKIYSAPVTGGTPSPIVSVSHLWGFALDLRPSEMKIYYFDESGNISRADLDGNNAEYLYSVDYGIQDIALDTCSDKLYLIGNTIPHPGVPVGYIRSMDLTTGNGLTTILSDDNPVSSVGEWGQTSKPYIAVDLHHQKMYWSSQNTAGMGQVRSADMVTGASDTAIATSLTGWGPNRGVALCLADNSCPTRFANKDFQNKTGQTVDGIDWLVQGTPASVTTHYDGPYLDPYNNNHIVPNTTFSSFMIVPSGPNTILRWSGGASIPDGGYAHVGFTVVGTSLTTLGATWKLGAVSAGCVHQVTLWEGHSHIVGGDIVFLNSATNCESQHLYVGNVRLEWFSASVPLAQLNAGGVRSPLRADDINAPPIPLDPGASASLTIPLPPLGANFAMIRYTVSASPTLAGPGNTIDYQEVPVGPLVQAACAPGVNLVVNPSFESPVVANDTIAFVPALTGWTTTDSQGAFELWSGTLGGPPAYGNILPQNGNQSLEINANDGVETVSQVITNLSTNCPTTFCFYYTGRYPTPANNQFMVELSGPRFTTISATLSPASYTVGGWVLYSTTFVPPAPLTIKFIGVPADGNAGGAHIDNVALVQQAPTITCPADITLTVPGSSIPVVVHYSNPTVTGGGLQGCVPPSGSSFPLGTTTVICTATNSCGTVTCSFNVTVLVAACGTGANLVQNGSFETPVVANNAATFVSALPNWTTTDSLGQFELWAGTGTSIPVLAGNGNQHLEINANDGNETVSQVINNLSTNCLATLCFYYTGRFPNPSNNTFTVELSGPGFTTILATLVPVSYAVGGWQLYSTTFVPPATLTIKFHGIPADGNTGGAHIDNVSLVQEGPIITCLASITTNICGSSVVVTYPSPTVTGGGLKSSVPASGSVFPLGTTVVTCTATNGCGTNTCTFTVTVAQVPALAMTCPANITTNICGSSVMVTYPSPTVTGGALKSSAPASGSLFPLGTTVVTCTATNACSTNTCTFNVTVIHNIQNLVLNGGFEVTSPVVAPNSFNSSLNPTTGVPGWTTAATNFLEVWGNTVSGIPASAGTNQLEINAQNIDETVSQVVTNLNTNCIATFCFDYTGRFGLVGGTYNNDFTVALSGGYSLLMALDPVTYSVSGWKSYCISFVPTTPTVTIAFHGHPHYSDGTAATQGGAHIDNVSLTQCCDYLPCPPNTPLNVALDGANLVFSWSGATYHLQGAAALTTPMVWITVPGSSPVTLPASGSLRYFRLVCP